MYSQNDVHTLHQNNATIYNPAATGLFNKQFFSLSNFYSPQSLFHYNTITSVYDYKLTKMNSGLGLSYSYADAEFLKNHSMNLNYSYQVRLKNERYLSFGVSAGLSHLAYDYNEININPSVIPYIKRSGNMFDMNMGIMYKTPKMYLGIASTTVLQTKSEYLEIKHRRDYNMFASYNIGLNSNFEIVPSVIMQSDFMNYTEYNLSVSSIYKKKFIGGLSYSNDNTFGLMLGFDLKEKYSFGYALNHRNYIGIKTSHEFTFAIRLK
ncbi:MAG: hypothetical protein A2W98_05465 [Bacteroidetes bacterium GWF2_33_38]|nr:MAG: hypothetical protein A2W98_05465 [Bacteroidetes bacterium GWF2_33_38]OFY92028.1 MAG: hypothetical protein A2236_10225 [Bacteroidetes bacterium RIFOXYA2_FULL_33_7]